MNTDCRKCKAPMPPVPRPKGNSPIDRAVFTATAYRCEKCGHWNNLKTRKK